MKSFDICVVDDSWLRLGYRKICCTGKDGVRGKRGGPRSLDIDAILNEDDGCVIRDCWLQEGWYRRAVGQDFVGGYNEVERSKGNGFAGVPDDMGSIVEVIAPEC